MTHAELQYEVISLCNRLGLHVHHCAMNRSQAGFPDLVIIGRRGVRWRELKILPDAPTSEQRLLGYKLTAAGHDWKVWTPAELASGEIETELEEIR